VPCTNPQLEVPSVSLDTPINVPNRGVSDVERRKDPSELELLDVKESIVNRNYRLACSSSGALTALARRARDSCT